MSKFQVIFERDLRKWLRNRRNLMWSIVVPLFIFVLGSIFGGSITGNHIIIVQESQGPFSNGLIQTLQGLNSSESKVFEISYMSDFNQARQEVALGHARAVLYIPQGFDENLTLHKESILHLLIDNSDPIISGQTSSIFTQLTPQIGAILRIETIFEKHFGYIDFFASAVPAMIAFQGAYQGAGISIVHDKEKGVWERYLVTPISNWGFMLGTVASSTVKAMISSLLAYTIATFIIGPSYVGPYNFLNGLLLLAISVVGWVGLSITIATRLSYNSYFTIGMLSNILILATSGMLYPVQGLPLWLKIIAYINPLTYSVEAFRGIMLRQLPISYLGWNFLFLLIFSLALIGIGVISLSRRIK